VDDRGQVLVGSSPSGIVYRVGADDAVFALLDSDFREVKALAVQGGQVYAALLEGASPAGTVAAPLAAPAAPEIVVTSAEVTVTAQAPPTPQPAPAAAAAPAAAGTTKGSVVLIGAGGAVETLWSSAEESPHSLAWTAQGVLVGTGNKGKLYRIRDDASWEMLASSTSEQVTALAVDARGRARLATSNPARVLALEDEPAQTGRFVSKVQDTKTVSSWGEVRFEADPQGGQVVLRSRSGNTATPDSTWSEWTAVGGGTAAAPLRSERARFLQLEARLTRGEAGTPVLDWISAAYLQRNLKPEIESITVHPPGVVFQKAVVATGQIQVLGLPDEEQPETPKVARLSPQHARAIQMSAFSRPLYQRGIQTIAWQASDPNEDDLVYAVDYRAAGEPRFRTLREGLAEPVLAWDTSTVPNGRYVVRVRASDSRSNPAALTLSASKESAIFWVDNTPPQVEATLEDAASGRIHAVARDGDSLVARTEFSVDGGRWHEVHPVDGINDSLEEWYALQPELAEGAGPHVVVVRTRDRLGNVATARVEIP
jgi:hypothetical protein